MRSDSKQALLLLACCAVLAAGLVAQVMLAYYDRNPTAQQIHDLIKKEIRLNDLSKQRLEVRHVEHEGRRAEHGAINPYQNTNPEKAAWWQLGYEKTHQPRQ